MRDYLKVCDEFGLESKYFTDEFVEGKMKFETKQKEFMLRCLMVSLDVEAAAKPELSLEEMIQVVAKENLGLEGNYFDGVRWRDAVTMMSLVKCGYKIEELVGLFTKYGQDNAHILLGAMEACPTVDISRLMDEGYDPIQISAICEMASHGIDVLDYIDNTFNADQIEQVADGLLDGIDVSAYCDSSIPRYEMEEIRFELSYCE